jgi:hypothetical protein
MFCLHVQYFKHIQELLLSVNYIRQTEIHTAQPLVPEPSYFEVEVVIESLTLEMEALYSSELLATTCKTTIQLQPTRSLSTNLAPA